MKHVNRQIMRVMLEGILHSFSPTKQNKYMVGWRETVKVSALLSWK